jgi:hypothetical protein
MFVCYIMCCASKNLPNYWIFIKPGISIPPEATLLSYILFSTISNTSIVTMQIYEMVGTLVLVNCRVLKTCVVVDLQELYK